MLSHLQIFKTTFEAWRDDSVSRHAAALAYYATFSLAPLLIIAVGVAGIVFGQEAAQVQLVHQIEGLIGPEGARFVQDVIVAAGRGRGDIIATAIGIGTLIFAATGVFAQLQNSLNAIWGVTPKPGKGIANMVQTRFLSFGMVLSIGFLLLVSLIVNALLAGLSDQLGARFPDGSTVVYIANSVLSYGAITFLFALLFKYLPDAKIRWRDVWVGAGVTAMLFSIGKYLIGLYLGRSTIGSTFGAAGSFAVILIWIYYSTQIFLFGAEFTQVYANRFGAEIVPNKDAVKVITETNVVNSS